MNIGVVNSECRLLESSSKENGSWKEYTHRMKMNARSHLRRAPMVTEVAVENLVGNILSS